MRHWYKYISYVTHFQVVKHSSYYYFMIIIIIILNIYFSLD